MKIIVGLGNPGAKYEKTRHNIGFEAIDKLKEHFGINEERKKFQALVSEKVINDEKILFVKPQTFMNLSGNAIREIVNFYKITSNKDIIVIYDDMDLPLGQLRIKEKGSSGGHNGIKSIISNIGEDFIRVRCGIGEKNIETIDYVLGKFSQSEQKEANEMTNIVVRCIFDMLTVSNLEHIMQNYNKKKIITC